MTDAEGTLRALAVQHGQEHVFAFWDELSEAAREQLLGQLSGVDFELVARHAELLRRPAAQDSGKVDLTPPELFSLERDAAAEERAVAACQRGRECLAQGKLAFLLVAGGQASRLGYDGPKGAFPIGPVSGRSLFELHARRVRAAGELSGSALDWYVMTSPANDAATREFFSEHQHFGLDPDSIVFFSQAVIPALDLEGKILLSGPDSLFLAPNGHGGTLAALESSGVLARAAARGIETLSYFQVDNPLVRPADPLFIGLHAELGARMSSKVVAKCDAAEKVGVIGRVDGKLGCIEYSDLPAELREARDGRGNLLFGAGNIAAHLLQVEFAQQLTRDGLELPWHVAQKRMQVIGPDGQPCEVDGAKFETFIFDALGLSPASVTLEVERALEFSPVKNAEGQDSPRSARRALCELHGAWAQAAGHGLPAAGPDGLSAVEVDPLLAEERAQFLAGPPPEPRVSAAGHLYERA